MAACLEVLEQEFLKIQKDEDRDAFVYKLIKAESSEDIHNCEFPCYNDTYLEDRDQRRDTFRQSEFTGISEDNSFDVLDIAASFNTASLAVRELQLAEMRVKLTLKQKRALQVWNECVHIPTMAEQMEITRFAAYSLMKSIWKKINKEAKTYWGWWDCMNQDVNHRASGRDLHVNLLHNPPPTLPGMD